MLESDDEKQGQLCYKLYGKHASINYFFFLFVIKYACVKRRLKSKKNNMADLGRVTTMVISVSLNKWFFFVLVYERKAWFLSHLPPTWGWEVFSLLDGISYFLFSMLIYYDELKRRFFLSVDISEFLLSIFLIHCSTGYWKIRGWSE